MTKRIFWCVSFVLGLTAQADQPPNILFIYLDDFGWKDTSYMGSDFYETPSYPNKNYPKFINIAILVESDIKPKKLLNKKRS